MTSHRTPQSDAPTKLSAVSDTNRAKAIADAISDVAGWNIHVEMTSCTYRGYVGPRGAFKHPTRLTCDLRLHDIDTTDATDTCINALRDVSDHELAGSIARRLSKVAGEQYVAEVSDRRYASSETKRSLGRISVLLALPESEN